MRPFVVLFYQLVLRYVNSNEESEGDMPSKSKKSKYPCKNAVSFVYLVELLELPLTFKQVEVVYKGNQLKEKDKQKVAKVNWRAL